VKSRAPTSTHKKVVVLLLDRTPVRGYLNPANLGRTETVDLLTPEGEHREIPLAEVKSVYFVREFLETFEAERKTFLSRPKLDGLWVRLRFRDEDVMEGMVSNDLLDLLDTGVHLTPPDLHGKMRVLGVVGVARRAARDSSAARAIAAAQPKLFG
jgi:hypothetical protein